MRSDVRLPLATLACIWVLLQFPGVLSAVAVGDRVQVISVTNIRSCASTSCGILAEAPVGSLGVVLSGPTSANGYTWWRIDWDSLSTGWSIQNNIAVVVTPSVSSISPTAMTADGAQHTLTINGGNFQNGNIVQFKWGVGTGSGVWNTGNSPSISSSTRMTVSMNPGTVNDTIYVRVCRSSSATSSSDCSSGSQSVAVSASVPVPSVSSISPTAMTADGVQHTLTINGSSFQSGNIVQFKWGVGTGSGVWNTGNSPSISSSTRMTVSMNPGTVNDTIYVRVCRSSSATSSSDCSSGSQSVAVSASVPVPSVSSISPTAMTADGVQHTLTINGSSFQSGNAVQFKWGVGTGSGVWNTGNSPSISSSTQMTVSMNPGTVNDTIFVRVCRSSSATTTSDCSSGSQSVAVSATVTVPVPSVSSISPTAMTADGAQHTLTINGGSFQNGNIVQFKWGQGSGSGVWNTGSSPSISSSTKITVNMNPGTVNDTIFVRVCRSSSAMNSSDCSPGTQSVAVTAATPPIPEEPGVMSSPGPQIACNCSSTTAASGQPAKAASLVTLLWRAAGTAQNLFQVVVEKLFGGSYQLVYQSTPQSAQSLALPAGILSSGNQYRWSVRGSTSTGWSSYSPPMYFRTETDSCVWSGPGTKDFRMPVGPSGPAGGNLKGLRAGTLTSTSPAGVQYPDLTFDEDGDGDTDWYVATANGQYLWRNLGTGGTSLACYGSSLDCGRSGDCLSDPQAAVRHPGEDWNRQGGELAGDKAYAVADGVIIARTCTANYGRAVLLAHRLPTGDIIGSFYAHLASFDVADPATSCTAISKGDPLGTIGGSTGCNSDCSGCNETGVGRHLHFELRKLRMINQSKLKSACDLNLWPASADTKPAGTCDWPTSTYPSCDGGAAFIQENYFSPSSWLQGVFSDSFELGDFSLWQSGPNPNPLTGVWRGTVAGYNSELTIEQNGSAFAARVSINQEPVEPLDVLSAVETDFVAYRPADNAELRLSLTQAGTQQCLTGEYLEDGSSRPISLCKAP